MDLHRSEKIPDWEKKPPEERSILQKIAAKTEGIVTPGNAISLWGEYDVIKGLYDIYNDQTLAGIIEVGQGRLKDVLDGLAAEITETKSPLGEAVDATLDKVAVAAAIPVLAKKDIISKKFAVGVLAQNGANTVLTAIAKKRGREIHADESGKLSTGFLWGAIGCKGLAKAAREYNRPVVATGLDILGHATTAIYAVLGAKATAGYFKDAFAEKIIN